MRLCVCVRERCRLVGQSELRQGWERRVNHILFIFFFALHLRHSEREKEGGRVGRCVVSRRVTIITAIECHIIGMRRPTTSTDGDVSRAVHPFIDPNIQTQSGNTADGKEK